MRFRAIFAGILAALTFAALPIGAASAKTFTVPCDANALVTAINNANNEAANPGKDTINLASGCNYVLTTPDPSSGSDGPDGLPVITSIVNIIGNGATISRSSNPATPSFRIMKVDTGGTLTATNLTLSNGLLAPPPNMFVSAAGAGLFNLGSVSLTSVSLRNNVVNVNGGFVVPVGGAVSNLGTLSMTYGDVTSNTASTVPCLQDFFTGGGGPGSYVTIPLGGGIANAGGLSITQTTIAQNSACGSGYGAFAVGGGIASGANPSATLDIKGARVINNNTNTLGLMNAAIGGGIAANTLSMTGTEVGNNTAAAFSFGGGLALGGGLATFGSTAVSKSSNIHDNAAVAYGTFNGVALGGGVANGSDLTILATTVTHNLAQASDGAFGGGVWSVHSLNVSASTITGNTAQAQYGTARGGGIYNGSGTATISASTVTGNQAIGPYADGGGIYNLGTVTIPGSAVQSNTPNNCAPAGSVPGCAG